MAASVSRQEWLHLLEILDVGEEELRKGDVPGLWLMHDRAVDMILRILTDPALVRVEEIDALLAAAREVGEYRLREHGHDPYAAARAHAFDLWSRLHAEIAGLPGRRPQQPTEAARASRASELRMLIRARRGRAGLTQVQLALKLNINQATVARWEAGVLAPSLAHRRVLAEVLGGRPADYEE